jgi:hypothetical protein
MDEGAFGLGLKCKIDGRQMGAGCGGDVGVGWEAAVNRVGGPRPVFSPEHLAYTTITSRGRWTLPGGVDKGGSV